MRQTLHVCITTTMLLGGLHALLSGQVAIEGGTASQTTLENGLRLIVQEDEYSAEVSSSISCSAGRPMSLRPNMPR
jgi:hypothetical protein